MKMRNGKIRRQTIVEYIIIVVIVAIAALSVMGVFSDRLRTLIAGAATTLGAQNADVSGKSVNVLTDMTAAGINTNE